MSGGKSYLLRWAALYYCIWLAGERHITEVPVGLFSEDYPTLKDRQIAKILREFPPTIGTLKESRDEGYAFFIAPDYGGSRILLRNLDDPSKYMSSEFAGIFVDELTRDTEETFTDLRKRLRWPGVDEVKFMGATNPGGIGHGWVKKMFVDKSAVPPDREQNRFFYVHANAYDNKFISQEYIKQLESLPERQRKAYLEGSWNIFEGQYFTEWSPLHIISPFVPDGRSTIVGGMDWGRANPFAFHLATVDKMIWRNKNGDSGTFYRVKTFYEAYGTEHTPDEWSEIITDEIYKKFGLSLKDITTVRADPRIWGKGDDGSESIRDQFYRANNDWRILQPANNDRITGWATVHKWLSISPDGLPFYQVTENCENLIRTLPLLIHDENNVEDVETSRKHGIDDDCGDAQRYMLKHITFIDGKTGQIAHRNQEEPTGNQRKFWGSNENMDQHLIDLSKFK